MQPNTAYINQILTDPAALAGIDMVDLQFWAIQYPQVPLFRTWLARKAKLEGHEGWQQYRLESAAMVQNRTILYHYLESGQGKVVAIPGTAIVTEATPAVPPIAPDNEVDTISPDPAEVTTVSVPPSAADRLLETLHKEETLPQTNEIVEVPAPAEDADTIPIETQSVEPAADEVVFDLTARKEEIKPPAEGLHSFIEWLDMLEQQPVEKVPVTESEWIEQPTIDYFSGDDEKSIPADMSASAQPSLSPVPGPEEDEPVAEPEGEDERVVVHQAQLSLEFSEDLMTETLAKLFVKQGKVAKAIKIYKALALHNPEKSSYFAALIKQLEDN
jgi:hypothetical protein